MDKETLAELDIMSKMSELFDIFLFMLKIIHQRRNKVIYSIVALYFMIHLIGSVK